MEKKVQYKSTEELKKERIKKDAAITAALNDPTRRGIYKIAAALTAPVKYYLDHFPIARQLVVVEAYPDGVPFYYDTDLPEVDAILVGYDGTVRKLVLNSNRVYADEFEIAVMIQIPFREIRMRKFDVIARARDRLMQALRIREDLMAFAAIHDASVITNTEYSIAGPLSKEVLTRAMRELEEHRLIVDKILGGPALTQSYRNWEWTQVPETTRMEVWETGYIGRILNARVHISQLIKTDKTTGYAYVYVLAAPNYLGWMPVRADTEVIPADQPQNLTLGFVGYEHLGFTIFNPLGVARVKFTPPA